MAQSSTSNRTRSRQDDETETSAADTVRNAADTVRNAAGSLEETVTDKLKSVGVDTDQMVNIAKDQVSELQRLLMDEMRARPMRALGIAAAVGLFVGLMTAR